MKLKECALNESGELSLTADPESTFTIGQAIAKFAAGANQERSSQFLDIARAYSGSLLGLHADGTCGYYQHVDLMAWDGVGSVTIDPWVANEISSNWAEIYFVTEAD